MWTIDLVTLEVVDTFQLSMGGKTIKAPLHIGFAYKSPLAVTGNILDKKNGYLTFLRTDTRRPSHIVSLSCPGARDAMFTFCLLYTSPSPRDLSTSRMPSSA